MSTTAAPDVPEQLIVDFDIYDPTLSMPQDTVQARIAELADKGPLVWSTAHGGHWVVTHYDQVHEVLHNPVDFSSYPNALITAALTGRFLPLEADPPEHTAYRNVLQPLFNPIRMKALEDEIRREVNELIDEFIEAGECEFVSAFAHILPARVFLALVGLPIEDAPQLNGWVAAALMGKPGASEEESNAVRGQAAMEVGGYFGKLIAERRGQEVTDESDVISVVVNSKAELGGETRALTDEELIQMFFLTLIAGLHTTQGSLCWGVMHMSKRPEQRQRIVDDPSMLPAAVEEILRIEAAVLPGRRATKDYELGGLKVREGDQLLLALCGANRDASHFDDPAQVSFDRKTNRHLSFGGGRHRCIGAHLARLELRVAFEELHRRLPDYEVAGDPMIHPTQTRGVMALPIRFTPGPREGAA
ncbi:Camphor 5-monooxygenase [Paraconexibacter sp. AEG42_29]|uniref:Camphor 5-monooxygenase n=1 Tax=Paraconexibacter sp. AEG42_29 TaxID=2997339 RepID=A0AAU7API3_9ACTN